MNSQVLVVSEIQYIWTTGSTGVCETAQPLHYCFTLTCEVMLMFSWLCWQQTNIHRNVAVWSSHTSTELLSHI